MAHGSSIHPADPSALPQPAAVRGTAVERRDPCGSTVRIAIVLTISFQVHDLESRVLVEILDPLEA